MAPATAPAAASATAPSAAPTAASALCADPNLSARVRARIAATPGLIFDMDGTIVDSEPNHHKATNHLLQDLGLPALSTEVLESYAGLPDVPMFADILDRLEAAGAITPEQRQSDPHLSIEYLSRTKRALYEQIYMPQNVLYERIAQLIKDSAAQGKRLALATSSPRSQADYILQATGLKPYFASIITGDMVEHGKPAPDIFLLAAHSLSLKPEDCLVFEDGQHGLSAAKAAHIDALHCLGGAIQALYLA